MWQASNTTPTPAGETASHTAPAISLVSLSCTWSLLLNISTILASLESPSTFPLGRYPMEAFP